MLNRTKQSYAFGSFKLLLRIINRYQPTERTDCELLQKSLLDKLKKEKKNCNLAETVQLLKHEPGSCNYNGTLMRPQEQLQPSS